MPGVWTSTATTPVSGSACSHRQVVVSPMPEPISRTTGRGGSKTSPRFGGRCSTSIPQPGSSRISADAADGVVRLRRGWRVRIRYAGRPRDIRTNGRFARFAVRHGCTWLSPTSRKQHEFDHNRLPRRRITRLGGPGRRGAPPTPPIHRAWLVAVAIVAVVTLGPTVAWQAATGSGAQQHAGGDHPSGSRRPGRVSRRRAAGPGVGPDSPVPARRAACACSSRRTRGRRGPPTAVQPRTSPRALSSPRSSAPPADLSRRVALPTSSSDARIGGRGLDRTTSGCGKGAPLMVTRARADYSVREVSIGSPGWPSAPGQRCGHQRLIQHAQRRPCACCAPPG